MAVMAQYRVKREDWIRFASKYTYEGFKWSDDCSLLNFNPFDGEYDDYFYIVLWDNGDIMYSSDVAVMNGMGYSDWKPYGCYFCTNLDEDEDNQYLDKDGDMFRVLKNHDGFEAGKVYLTTFNNYTEAKFCPVCGEIL